MSYDFEYTVPDKIEQVLPIKKLIFVLFISLVTLKKHISRSRLVKFLQIVNDDENNVSRNPSQLVCKSRQGFCTV